MRTEKIYKFKTADGDIIEMNESTLNLSNVLRQMVSTYKHDENQVIYIERITTRIFKKIILWADLHFKHLDILKLKEQETETKNILDQVYAQALPTDPPYKLETWQTTFLDIDQTTLRDLIMAANFLHIQELMDMCCKYIASKISGKTTEQIRQIFNITNDFTPEEEYKILEEHKYCDDPDI